MRVCVEFAEAWKSGSPSLEEYLDRVACDDRRPLLRNLLDVDIESRRTRGESPTAGDYLGRLPAEFSDLVRAAFLDASTGHRHSAVGVRADETRGGEVPSATRLGTYRLVRELGRGGMGAVYEAVHAVRGHRIALKTLPTVSGDSLHRFKREFRALADVTHPNLVGLHTLESDGSQWFITLDLLEGTDFLQHVRPRNTLDLPRLRAAIAQLCTGVMALHARGVVHRDLKPSNVMVTRDGRVVILDFGLVAELDRAGAKALSQSVTGTPAYMAPEQVSPGTIGPAADWYAVGVMLYEALSGVRPFDGSGMQILVDKCANDAPPVPRAAEHAEDLVALCHALLARQPEARPDPAQIAAVCSVPVAGVTHAEQRPDQLVGRELQRRALCEVFSEFLAVRQPVVAFIQGRSGEGKSSLAELFLEPLRCKPALVVISGRCYDRESVPFKALDMFVDALASHLKSLADVDAALLLPDDISMLVELFPVLRRCEVIARVPRSRLDVLDQQQVRQRGFASLRLLLDRIGAQTPLVCFIDDLHWGDADSAAALLEVLRPPDAPPVFFLGSFRSDEADTSPFLKEWSQRTRQHGIELKDRSIGVGPLELEDAVQLVVQLLDRNDEIVRRRAVQFHAQSGGNPFLLTELVGCFDPDSDAFHASDIYGVLDRKLAALPPEASPLLDAVAVSGQALTLAEAAEAAALRESPEHVLTRLRNARLLRIVGEKVDTYHDRIRYAVLDRLADNRRRALHVRLAQAIERSSGGFSDAQLDAVAQRGECGELPSLHRIYDISYHYDAAGDCLRGRAYGLAAAMQARAQFALDVAVQQFAIAQRNALDASPAVRFKLARGKAESLLQLGRYDESKKELDEALSLATSRFDLADVHGLLGELASKLGQIGQSIEHYEAGIRNLGIRVPRTLMGMAAGIAGQAIVQAAHSLAPHRIRQRAPDPEARLANHLLARIDWSYYCHNSVKLVWASLVGLNRAEREPPSHTLTVNYVVHANDMAVLGWHSRATKYYSKARRVSQELNDHWGAAQAANHSSFGCISDARYRDALQLAEPGVAAFQKLGDLWELHLVYMNLCTAHFRLGNFAEAIHYARILFDHCVRLGDNYMAPASLFYLSRFSFGRIRFAELSSCVQVHRGNHLGSSMVSLAEGFWHLHQRRTDEAVAAFDRAWVVARKNFCVMPPNANVLADLTLAVRMHAEHLETQDSSKAAPFRRRWRSLVPWVGRLARLFPAERPQALREASLLAWHRGALWKALKLADRSCLVAQRQEAAHEHSQSLLIRGRIAQELGLPDADAQIAQAQRGLDQADRDVDEALSRHPRGNGWEE